MCLYRHSKYNSTAIGMILFPDGSCFLISRWATDWLSANSTGGPGMVTQFFPPHPCLNPQVPEKRLRMVLQPINQREALKVEDQWLQIELLMIANNYQIESQRNMQRAAPVCVRNSFFDLAQLDDPLSYKNQSFSLKFIHSICQLPSFNDFNEFGAKQQHHYEERYEDPQEQPKEGKMEMDQYIQEAEDQSDKQDKSISSTNANLCSGSHISIAENIQLSTIPSSAKKGTGCNCKKTGCLKMYCECFSSGKVCTDQCNCCNCSNCDAESQTVRKAKEVARNKHRFAFSPVDGTNRKHCNCRKTQCQKKYCECYNSGQACSQLCKCEDCLNGTHSPEQHEEGMQELVC